MTETHELITLGGAAKMLNVKPFRIQYAITNGLVPEPACRVANKRVFNFEDIERLEAYFQSKQEKEAAKRN